MHFGDLILIRSFTAKLSANSATRREVFEGAEHLVVPVVMIVEGVLNDSLLLAEEFGRYVESWNGVPVPVLHPEQNGEPVSANAPDVIEKNSVGQIFNAAIDGQKLRAEAWINIDKATRLGFAPLVAALEAGEIIEVSTGYFSDSEVKPGDYNGIPYSEIHRNIRPDHLALLPGQVGACSVADGCGTRVNSQRGIKMKVNEALKTIAQALGLRTNCECKEVSMDIMKKAEALKANGSITAKQFQMLQEMDSETRAFVAALIDAMGAVAAAEDEPDDMAADPAAAAAPVATQAQKQTINADEVQKLVANALRRQRVMDALKANSACAFDEKTLETMSVEALEVYEKSIRPADYSGAVGFASNSNAVDTNVVPLLPRGALAKQKEA